MAFSSGDEISVADGGEELCRSRFRRYVAPFGEFGRTLRPLFSSLHHQPLK